MTINKIAVAIVPKITGFLSFVASIFLSSYVLISKERRSKIANWILLGLSISDISFSSVSAFMSTWPVPTDTRSNLVFIVVGFTCEAQCFFDQWSAQSSYPYNAVLAFTTFELFGSKWPILSWKNTSGWCTFLQCRLSLGPPSISYLRIAFISLVVGHAGFQNTRLIAL